LEDEDIVIIDIVKPAEEVKYIPEVDGNDACFAFKQPLNFEVNLCVTRVMRA